MAARSARYTETDLDLGQMVDLFLSVSAIAPGDVRNQRRGRTATIGGLVVLLAPGARDMFRDFMGDAFCAADPGGSDRLEVRDELHLG